MSRFYDRFTLADFVTESNRIEGMGPAQPNEIAAHIEFLATRPSVATLGRLVYSIAGAELRSSPGMDVRVGFHLPPHGGVEIVRALESLLAMIHRGNLSPYEAHQRYEALHPFMDGNGRSGRALWLWQMDGIEGAPLGFLHHFYYQALDGARRP